jgi:hypothetical protein
VATLAVFVNVVGLIVFLHGRADRLLAAVVDPLHPDWTGMERAFSAFSIYAVSLVGAAIVAVLLATRALLRRYRTRQAPSAAGELATTAALAIALTTGVVLVFIEVLIFQDYGIHFYEFDVPRILADAALRRDLGIQPSEVARVAGASVGLIVAQLGLCYLAARVADWRNGALPRSAAAAMLIAVPGGFAVFHASEREVGALRSELTSALPLGRQLLLRRNARPYIPVAPKLGRDGYPVLGAQTSAPALARKPSIVFYVPDGLRADMVNDTLTPTLMTFARSADVITSDRHFSTGHVSEAGIFGLLYALRAHSFNAFIEQRVPAYPVETLKRNGYHTFFISSSRLNPYPSDQLIRMFDEVAFPANDDEALAALERYVEARRRDGRPYFMLAFFYTPHYPFTSAKPQHRRFPLVGPKARPNYMNDVIQADDYFRLALERIGSPDSTIVVFTSDHGEEIRDHGGFGHASATFWNEKVQVPLYLKLPGATVPRAAAPLSSHVDVWPTIFDHLGVAPDSALRWSDGASLLHAGRGQPAIVTGRFFPFADRPSVVVHADRKIWFRASGVGGGVPCLEVTRITDLADRPVRFDAQSPVVRAALAHVQETFWRFLRHTGPQTAPCPSG